MRASAQARPIQHPGREVCDLVPVPRPSVEQAQPVPSWGMAAAAHRPGPAVPSSLQRRSQPLRPCPWPRRPSDAAPSGQPPGRPRSHRLVRLLPRVVGVSGCHMRMRLLGHLPCLGFGSRPGSFLSVVAGTGQAPGPLGSLATRFARPCCCRHSCSKARSFRIVRTSTCTARGRCSRTSGTSGGRER